MIFLVPDDGEVDLDLGLDGADEGPGRGCSGGLTSSFVEAASGWKTPEAVGLLWLLVGWRRMLDALPTLRLPASRVDTSVVESALDVSAPDEQSL